MFAFNHVDSYLVLVDEVNDPFVGLHKEDESELFIIASFNYNTQFLEIHLLVMKHEILYVYGHCFVS